MTGIAINPSTKWIIAHTNWVNPKLILILDPNGNLKGAYTYVNSPDYQILWRNLLLGYDSTTLTYTALVQTILATGNGYKLFAFTFRSFNSAPSF
jgi:hypothetical protein